MSHKSKLLECHCSHLYSGVQQQGNQEQYEQYPQYEEQVQATHNLPLQVVKHTNSTGTQHKLWTVMLRELHVI